MPVALESAGGGVLAVATSGGRDSTALLHAVCRQASGAGLQVLALHVNHGLQPEADAWEIHIQRQVSGWRRAGWPVSFLSWRLRGGPAPGESVEAWARRERYAALAQMAREAGCTLVLLAHHRRDQAETVMLQALRGAGAAGLAAMPRQVQRDGICWVRPWLQQPREAIDSYVRRWRLRWVEDPSNESLRFDRNRFRHRLWPVIVPAFPSAEAALAQVATEAAWAKALMDEVATADLPALLTAGGGLRADLCLRLSPARRRAVLQRWLQAWCQGGVPHVLLDRLMCEWPGLRVGRWPSGRGGEVRLYRDQLSWVSAAPQRATLLDRGDCDLPWPQVVLRGGFDCPGWAGQLMLRPVSRGGLPEAWLQGARLVPRRGGEQFQAHPSGLPRSLKKQFQAAGVPAWLREGPLLRSSASRGDKLLFVPGLGLDARIVAPPGVTQWALSWHRLDPECASS